MFYLGCVNLNCDKIKTQPYQRCANAAIISDCWMLLIHSCFDSGVFWPELSPAPTVCISQIFILFRNTRLYWDGNRVRWFNGHTRGSSWVPKFLQFRWSSLGDQTPEGSFRRPRDAMIQDPLRGHESVQKMEGSGWQLLLIKANFKGWLNCWESCIWEIYSFFPWCLP